MVSDRPSTTRRGFLATSAVLFGAGCASPSNVDEPGGRQTMTEPTATRTAAPTDTGTATRTEEPTETPDPAENRLHDTQPSVNPEYMGRFIPGGRMVDNFEDLTRWTVEEGGELRADAGRKFAGVQSLRYEGTGRVVLSGDYRADPIDIEGEDLSFGAFFDKPDDRQPRFYLTARAPDYDNRVVFTHPYISGKDAGWQRIDIAPMETYGNPDLTDVRELRLSMNVNAGSTARFWFDDLRAHDKPDTGKVIFRFDDGHLLQYEDYYPVLDERDYQGLFSVVKQNFGNKDRVTVKQALELQDAGWDLVNHMTEHQNVTELSNSELRRDIREMDDMFDQYGFERGTDMHTYTYGAYSGRTLDVMKDHFEVAFGGGAPTNYKLTNPMVVGSFDAETGIEATESMLDRAAKHRSLLVLMFHDGYDRAEFERIVDYVAAEDRLEVITGTDLKEDLAKRNGN